MKKAISVLLVLVLTIIVIPVNVLASVTVTIADEVTYSSDLVYLKLAFSSNVSSSSDPNYDEAASSFALIFDAYDENNDKVTDIQSCLQFVSIDLSNLPSGTTWACTTNTNTKMLKNKTSQQFNVQIYENVGDIDDTSSIYSDNTGYLVITLRKLTTATHSIISLKPNSSKYKVSTFYGTELATSKSSAINISFSALEPTISIIGAQIRTSAPQGLRFIADFAKDDFYTAFGISGDYDYARDKDNIQFGMFIALTDTVSGSLTHGSTCKKIDIPAVYIFSENSSTIRFTGVVINMPTDGSYDDTDFTAVAYVKVGSTYYYSNELVRSVNFVKSAMQA